jgi:hypothetical protein
MSAPTPPVPRLAYAPFPTPSGGYLLGVVEEDVPGWLPVAAPGDPPRELLTFGSYEEAQVEAVRRNDGMGLTREEALEIRSSSKRAEKRKKGPNK